MENSIILFVFLVVIALIYINSATRESLGGSFLKNCKECKLERNFLTCLCKYRSRVGFGYSTLNVNNCGNKNNIRSNDSRLIC